MADTLAQGHSAHSRTPAVRYNDGMVILDLWKRWRRMNSWLRELALAAFLLLFGGALMPLLIYLVGSSTLGRYEGASAGRIYGTVYGGLQSGSVASWIVLVGPYGLYVLMRLLGAWWRLGASRA